MGWRGADDDPVASAQTPQTLEARVTGSTPTAVTVTVDAEVGGERSGLGWNKGGMIKGPATVPVEARFTRSE